MSRPTSETQSRGPSPRARFSIGIGLLIVAAFVGWMLISAPSLLIDSVERIEKWQPGLGKVYLGIVGVGAAIFVIASLGILYKLYGRKWAGERRRQLRSRAPSELSESQQRSEFQENLRLVDELSDDDRVGATVRTRLAPDVRTLEDKLAARTLEIVAFGTISSGKSSLLNLLAGRDVFDTDPRGGTTVRRNEVPWPGNDRVTLVDTPGLAESRGEAHGAIAAQAARDADLVMVVLDGPLRQHEHLLLAELAAMEKRCVVCLNKSDWFQSADLEKLLSQIRGQVEPISKRIAIVAVRAEGGVRERIRQAADGSTTTETVPVSPDISQLSQWMLGTISSEGDRLLLANLLLRSRGLVERARDEVIAELDRSAWREVDRAMWGAGGIAALTPFPIVDLLAGVAISTKLVVDLARIYRQEVDIEVAKRLLSEMSKTLLGILGTSLALPTVAAVASQVLKAVPGVGTIAGGLLQGLVQALITRWIGATFIEYFRTGMRQPEGGLTGLARRQWERLTRPEEMKQLIQQARTHLSSKEST